MSGECIISGRESTHMNSPYSLIMIPSWAFLIMIGLRNLHLNITFNDAKVTKRVSTVLANRDSSAGIATRYSLEDSGGSIPGGARFSAPVQTYLSPSSAKVKERAELYLYSPSGPSWPVLRQTLPLPLPTVLL
jgi:hypothetical protein